MTAGELVSILVRRWYVVVAGLLITVYGCTLLTSAQRTYFAEMQLVFVAPGGGSIRNVPDDVAPSLINFAGLVQRQVSKNGAVELPSSTATLYGSGVRDGYSLTLPNSGNQWVASFSRPVLLLQVVGHSPQEVQATLDNVVSSVDRTASNLQEAQGATAARQVFVDRSPAKAEIVDVGGTGIGSMKGLVALVLVGVVGSAFLAVRFEALFLRRRHPRFPKVITGLSVVPIAVGRRRTGGWDAVSVLTCGMVLCTIIPSSQSVAALGPLGKPAVIWFLGAFLWWEWTQLQRPFRDAGTSSPTRTMLFALLAAFLVSYAVGALLGLPPAEAQVADSALIKAASWFGILLIANDGIAERHRLLVLLRRLTIIGAAMALLGLAQFWTGSSLIGGLSIPGFSGGGEFENVQGRAGFLRAAGTASHPLEYAVVLSMTLPLALTLAMNELRARSLLRWVAVGVIMLASALAVSRSALVGIAAGLIILLPGWSRRARMATLGIGALGAVAMYFLVPGMVGTLRGLFTGLSDDASTSSRVNSVSVATEIAERSIWFGRSLGTFLPDYQILDNQYLLLFVEVGLVGVCAFIGLVLAAVYCCIRARRRFDDPFMKQICSAIMASVVSGAVLFAFFDVLSFPMSAAFLFLMLGVSGAVWRIAQLENPEITPSAAAVGVHTGPRDEAVVRK